MSPLAYQSEVFVRYPLTLRCAVRCSLLALIVGAFPVTASANPAKPVTSDRVARRLLAPSTTQVVVRYRDGTSAASKTFTARRVGKRTVTGATHLHLDLLRVADPAAAIRKLNALPDVVWAEPLTFSTRYAESPQPELTTVGVTDSAWSGDPGLRGTGVSVGVIDDGVSPEVPDLAAAGKVIDGGSFADDGTRRSTGGTTPSGDHGTGVAALVAGTDTNGTGIRGTAPDATIRAYRVFEPSSSGASSLAIAAAIERAADDGVAVINLSLGSPFRSRSIGDAIAAARAAHPALVVLASAGNDHAQRPSYPAGFPGVLSVAAGATISGDPVQHLASFSSLGDADVLAPGSGVLTWQRAGGTGAWELGYRSGTSFASPLAAGIAAALAGRIGAGAVTGDVVAAALKASAAPAEAPTGQHVGVGAGELLAPAAAGLLIGASAHPFGAVFVDDGAAIGRTDPARSVRVVQVVPPMATSGSRSTAVTIDAAVWTVATTAPTVRTWGTTGSVSTIDGTLRFANPSSPTDFTATEYPLTTVTTRDGTAVAEHQSTTAVLSLPHAAGAAGAAAVSAVAESVATGSYGFSSWSRRMSVPAGAVVAATVDYPDTAAAPLVMWQPTEDGGQASTYDVPVFADVDSNGQTVDGTVTFTAPVAGNYVLGFLPHDAGLGGTDGTYSLAVSTPITTMSDPVLSSTPTADARFPVAWSAPGATSRYDTRYTTYTASGSTWTLAPWRSWLTGTSATETTFGASEGSTWYIQARGTDQFGNIGPWSIGARTAIPYDDRNAVVVRSAGWRLESSAARYRGTISVATATGSSISVTGTGSRLSVVGDRCAGCGQVRVYVDGALTATVDSYQSTTAVRQVLWISPVLTGGFRSHTLKVVVVGTSGRPAARIDGLGVHR
jgi:hypothetical protein